MKRFSQFLLKNKTVLLFLLLFFLNLFLRFYKLEYRSQFTWDQINNAWAAKNILADHRFPLLGMAGKLNSGIYVGPLYYYFAAIFYFFTNLDPIASPIVAGVTGIFSFLVIYLVSKKIFSENVGLIAIFLYTVSNFIIEQDRLQWPVNFIPALSLLIFYCLWKVINGENKYILYTAILTGLFFHIHLTAVFFLLIILFSLPLFPWNIKTLKYILISLLIFLLFFIPQFIYYLKFKNYLPAANYLSLSYHGFHLRRVLQLAYDAFIEFEGILGFRFLRWSVFFYLPLFLIFYFRVNSFKKTFRMGYLMLLWIFMPWFVLSTYSGELSNYYFASTRFIALGIFAYIIVYLWQSKFLFLKPLIILMLACYAFFNLREFFKPGHGNLIEVRAEVDKTIKQGIKLPFVEGDPKSYLYYIRTRRVN